MDNEPRAENLPHKRTDLTHGPITGHLVRLTIPMIWGIFAVISIQLIDTYFISLLGTKELTGISFTFPVTMVITHLVFGINIAMSSVVSRMIGQKLTGDAKRITLHGIMLAFSISAVLATLCYCFMTPLFKVLGADEASLGVVYDYMPLWLLGSCILAIPVNGNSAIRASGDSFTPAIVMTSLALVNLVLDPLLIFGLAGFPAMGVKGAALATLIAYIWGACFGLFMLVRVKDLLPRDGLHLKLFGDSVRRLAFIAIPAGITNIIQPATNAVMIAILASHGPAAVAAFGVGTRIEAFALLIVISLALAMAPIIGQNWGAREFERVNETIRKTMTFNFIWSFTVAIILGIFASPIAGVFSDDPNVIEVAEMFFWVVPVSYAFSNLVMGWGSAFNAMGMPQRSFFMVFVKSVVLTIPAVFIGSHLYGVYGVFFALAGVNIVSGIAFHLLSYRLCLSREAQEQQGLA